MADGASAGEVVHPPASEPEAPAQNASAAADGSTHDPQPVPGMSHLRSVVQSIGAVAAPASIVTALAFYIGTVRQETFARYFGLDVSVLGFTPQDHMLRSTDALVPFLAGLCALLLMLLTAWALAAVWLQRYPAVRPVLAWTAFGVGAFGVAVGVGRLMTPVSLTGFYLGGPISLGLGSILVAAGAHLAIDHGYVSLRNLPATFGTIGTAATVVLLLLALFWAANDYARVQGGERAVQLAGSVGGLPGVVIHSDSQLHLSSPGVDEQVLTTADGEHVYRYDGLRLLVRSGGQYFLIPTSWSRSAGAVVVLRDDEQVQLEFVAGGRS